MSNPQIEDTTPRDSKAEDKKDPSQSPEYDAAVSAEDVPSLEGQQNPTKTARPPLDYSSTGAFLASVGRRIGSIFTKRFVLSLLAGQLVSLCITCTSVVTTELVNRNWALPTTQTFFL